MKMETTALALVAMLATGGTAQAEDVGALECWRISEATTRGSPVDYCLQNQHDPAQQSVDAAARPAFLQRWSTLVHQRRFLLTQRSRMSR